MARIAVVGAGYAGLAAALAATDAGHDVVVLEARERVGGRVWSERLPDGSVVERGAEFVLDGYQAMAEHLTRFGLRLADTGMSYYRRDPRGVADVGAADVAAAGDRLAAAPRPPGATVANLLAALDEPPGAVEALRARIEISCAWGADELAPAVVDHVADTRPLPSHRVAGGNQRLATAMSDRLGHRVRCGTPVHRVRWSADEVRLDCGGDAGEVLVDAAVVAVPLPVLRDLPFEPALPAAVVAALGRATMGQAAKLHVPLRRPAPVSAVMSVPERYWCWTATAGTSATAGTAGTVADGGVAPVVHCFAGSPAALAALAVTEGPERWLDSLGRLRPDLDLDPAGAVLVTWADDPWTRGAYLADCVRARPGDGELLAAPCGPLHFAGEHTAGEWSGLMEGALRSGVRAAREL